MKFAPNHLYIEEYVKCANCGVLIYEQRGKTNPGSISRESKIYCSQWCLDWEQARAERDANAASQDRLEPPGSC
jgi:hypothetical protein